MKNGHQIRTSFPIDVISVPTVTICLPSLKENDQDSQSTNGNNLSDSCKYFKQYSRRNSLFNF